MSIESNPPPPPDYDNFSLVVNPDTVEMSREVLGEVWVWTPEFEFPERGWIDLVAVVTGSFLLEAYLLLGGRHTSSVSFMRGPVQVGIEAVRAENWRLEGVWRGASRTHVVAVRPRLVVRELVRSARVVLNVCQRRGWEPKSVVGMEVGIARLEREAAFRFGSS